MKRDNIKNILFSMALKKIYFNKEDKEKILNQKRIYLEDIFQVIDNKDIIGKLMQYEEQNHTLTEKRLKLFYKQGFDDALNLVKLLKI